MQKWLASAVDYIPRWLEFQMRVSQQPGCVVAIVHRGEVVLEQAFGLADLVEGRPLTPRHRFRVASHSKTYTAAGVMKLREEGKLKLDDAVGQYVEGLNARVGRSTIAQLLSHSAGLARDGRDGRQFTFRTAEQVMADLAGSPIIEPNTRFKYSNHGYALLGLAIEAATGEPFARWIKRNIIDAAGLKETRPDMPVPASWPVASGHSGRLVLGRRVAIPGNYSTNAVAPAAGVVTTARELALFFAQLSPRSPRSVLSVASRREMARRQWRNPHSSFERYYGLGTISGTFFGWDWFGHSGGLQGYITRTCVFPEQDLTVAVLTNAIDGWAAMWVDGAAAILQAFARRGPPSRKVRDWTGRWWSLWGAIDLIPAGERVLAVAPGMLNPIQDASELDVAGRDVGRVAAAEGYSHFGEPVRRERNAAAQVSEVWIGAAKLVPEDRLAAEMRRRYGRKPRKRRARQPRRKR